MMGLVAGYVVAVFAVVARTTVPSCHRAAPEHVYHAYHLYYDVRTRVYVCASVYDSVNVSVRISVRASVCQCVFCVTCLLE